MRVAARRSPGSARRRAAASAARLPIISAVHVRHASNKATTQRDGRVASLRCTGWRRGRGPVQVVLFRLALLSRARREIRQAGRQREIRALARTIAAPRSEEHQMSVFIVSRRTDRSRPIATRRCTTKGSGHAWTPGPAGSALPDPPPLCRPPRCPGPSDGLARSWLWRCRGGWSRRRGG